MHNLASNNKHSHGVEGSETGDTSLLQCFGGQFSVIVVSSEPKALWVVVMYTMNNYTYNAMRFCDSRTYKALYLSCLGAKDTTQTLWETLVSLLKKYCCHKKCCGRVECAAV